MRNPLCFLRWITRSIRSLVTAGYPMSGHQLVEHEVVQGATVQVLRCTVCGHYSIAWSRP